MRRVPAREGNAFTAGLEIAVHPNYAGTATPNGCNEPKQAEHEQWHAKEPQGPCICPVEEPVKKCADACDTNRATQEHNSTAPRFIWSELTPETHKPCGWAKEARIRVRMHKSLGVKARGAPFARRPSNRRRRLHRTVRYGILYHYSLGSQGCLVLRPARVS